MKRHEALAPLSREHHSSLLLAQSLKKDSPGYKGMPEEPTAKAAYAINLFRTSIQGHFSKEEAMLGKVKNDHPEILNLTDEIISEHQQLMALFLSLDTSADLVNALDALGHALEKHIRKEERVLFPLLQQHCSEKELKEVEQLLLS